MKPLHIPSDPGSVPRALRNEFFSGDPHAAGQHISSNLRGLSRLCLTIAFTIATLGLTMTLVSHPAAARTHHSHTHSHKSTAHHYTGRRHKSHLSLLGNSPKYASLVMDARTGHILQATDPDKVLHPASLTKMMTLMLVFQALNDGRITMHDQVRMSAHAHSMQPSKLDIPVGSSIRLDDAILAVVTHSANDVAVALAEHVGGTEGTFASMMTRAAKQLGMTHTYFVNASGLHNPKQVTSARDMAILARALIYGYPQYYHYFSTRSFSYDGHNYINHNHLMFSYKGMDGIKTGYIGPSGFNLVASVKRNNQRLIGVVFGGQSARWRDQRMTSLLNRAFAQENAALTAKAIAPQAGTAATTGNTLAQARPSSLNPAGQPTQQAAISPAAGAEGQMFAHVPATTTPAAATPALTPSSIRIASTAPDLVHAWGVQIGAFENRNATAAALKTVMNGLPASLRHATPAISPLLTADGTVYRGRLNGFTRAEALSVCSRLTNCLTVSPYANN